MNPIDCHFNDCAKEKLPTIQKIGLAQVIPRLVTSDMVYDITILHPSLINSIFHPIGRTKDGYVSAFADRENVSARQPARLLPHNRSKNRFRRPNIWNDSY